MLKGKTILLGVTGSIAAYKAASLVSQLVKMHASVHVLMTNNACNFINPVTFETLSGNQCLIDTFDKCEGLHVPHIALAKKADIMMIAPASADAIGKIANGIADDMLTTTVLACQCPVVLAPAMNTRMYENKIVQDNVEKLKFYGYKIAESTVGYLACGDVGSGKMLEPEVLVQYILKEIACKKDLQDKKVLVTAGPTRESIDPVRYITNHSTGKMGYAVAKMAMLRGAKVTLITGETSVEAPMFVDVVRVSSAKDMYDAVKKRLEEQDIIVKTAAVADYTPAETATEKIKKSGNDMDIKLVRTTDILEYIGENKRKDQFVCGFSMETENVIDNSRAKLRNKKIEMIAANNLKVAGAGFGTDTNVITLITKDTITELPIMAKEKAAETILDAIVEQL